MRDKRRRKKEARGKNYWGVEEGKYLISELKILALLNVFIIAFTSGNLTTRNVANWNNVHLHNCILYRKPFHKKCVKCRTCGKGLTPATLNEHETQLYCNVSIVIFIFSIVI